MVRGTIKIGKPTAGHAETLKKCGYSVQEADGLLHVQGSEFVASLDLSGSDEETRTRLITLVKNKQLLTYSTRVSFRTPDGEVRTLTSLPMVNTLVALCRRLGIPNLSAVVVKPEGKGASAPSPDGAAEFFAAIAE